MARQEEVISRPTPMGTPPDHVAFSAHSQERVPRVAVVELPRGRVLGPHAAVITDSGSLVHEICFYFGTTRFQEHPVFLHPFPGAPVEVGGRLGVLASRGDSNYYHFLMDVLPRMGVLDQCAEVEPPERWYAPAGMQFQQELLNLAGISPQRLIDSSTVSHVRAECLVVPGLAATDVKNPPWVVSYLRDLLLPSGLTRIPGRNLYVTRGIERNNRRVVNEEQLLAELELWGFEQIDPSGMSVREQIATFATADLVIAPHGAALANLVFASPGATVIELFPAAHIVPDYWKLACGVPGLQYRYLAGVGKRVEADRSQLLITDVMADVSAVRSMLGELRLGRS